MTHEWKVGDRAIAEGYDNLGFLLLGRSAVIHDLDTWGLARIEWHDGVKPRSGTIHVRNLTPDRRKGEQRNGLNKHVFRAGDRVWVEGAAEYSSGSLDEVVIVAPRICVRHVDRRTGKDRRKS